MSKQWTIAGKIHRDNAVRALRRLLDDNREDRLNQILVDALGDLILAAKAEGFSREEIRGAIFRGAWHGWSDAHAPKGDPTGGDGPGLDFARELGDWPQDWAGARPARGCAPVRMGGA